MNKNKAHSRKVGGNTKSILLKTYFQNFTGEIETVKIPKVRVRPSLITKNTSQLFRRFKWTKAYDLLQSM